MKKRLLAAAVAASLCIVPTAQAQWIVLDPTNLVQNTPPLLSVGKRVMDLGYDFHWQRYSRPFLRTPEGLLIVLSVLNKCPYLIDEAVGTFGRDFLDRNRWCEQRCVWKFAFNG